MKDKIALVTGASSGIGRATALKLVARGAKVVAVSRRINELNKLVDDIKTSGGSAYALTADVSSPQDVEQMVKAAVGHFGRLDIAVNNAGIEGAFQSLLDFDEEEWNRVLATNLTGNFLSIKHQANAMLEHGDGGAIVNVGSINSFLGFAGGVAYTASKHGQIAITSSASAELAPQGIRVNLICPGVIDTPMYDRLRQTVGDETYDQLLGSSVHLRRAGKPEEIAASIAFLCSDEASYVTGATLTSDGGYLNTM